MIWITRRLRTCRWALPHGLVVFTERTHRPRLYASRDAAPAYPGGVFAVSAALAPNRPTVNPTGLPVHSNPPGYALGDHLATSMLLVSLDSTAPPVRSMIPRRQLIIDGIRHMSLREPWCY